MSVVGNRLMQQNAEIHIGINGLKQKAVENQGFMSGNQAMNIVILEI